ncbi:MAG: ribosomal protein S18-alanine N-acetyltransferase, partial [Oscillospiraceae bacterium]|nr:ribosomal protein S18-alanine N-acetyltransferase [Oscillospiraceae bacterium]
FELRSEYADFLLACEGERLLGFAIAHLAGDDSELFNICVAESERGRGIGGALIDECVRLAEKRGAGRMLLEVRASNKTARSLYLKKGFQVLGVRRNYYEFPTEDAVMMERELKPN